MRRLSFSLFIALSLSGSAFALPRSVAKDLLRTRILRTALEEAESFTPDWKKEQRDCAGYVRYVFRRSLAKSRPIWVDRHDKKVDFVSAGELVAYNFTLLGRDTNAVSIETGDLLVFKRNVSNPEDAWHLMLVLSPPQAAAGKLLVAYHNGDKKKGEVRKIWLDDLKEISAGEWRADAANKTFQGVYRWKELF